MNPPKGNCDLCGIDTDLMPASVEGTILNVCRKCSRFGKVLRIQTKREEKPRRIIKEPEEVDIIAKDYSSIIKNARENLGMRQEDLARKINEKESLIHRIESGHAEPNMAFAKKLENALNIKLIEAYREGEKKNINIKEEGLTIGDLIKIKQRKR